MIAGVSALAQALLGTLLTWGLTAAGSAVVFLLPGTKVLEGLCLAYYIVHSLMLSDFVHILS